LEVSESQVKAVQNPNIGLLEVVETTLLTLPTDPSLQASWLDALEAAGRTWPCGARSTWPTARPPGILALNQRPG
jgi:hypothetical protein